MKKGFTLAEVLITLAVIGVVAALSIPELVTANKRKVYSAALSTAVTNVESALFNMITNESVNYLDDTAFYVSTTDSNPDYVAIAGELGRYLDVERSGSTATSVEPGYPGVVGLNGTNDNATMSTGIFIKLKNGTLLNFEPSLGDLKTIDHGMQQRVFILNIDVNGVTEPNRCGRDVFKFAVDTTGKLYPFGGVDYNIYSNTGLWTSGGNYGCASGNLGWGCAGRLVSNGFVMDY